MSLKAVIRFLPKPLVILVIGLAFLGFVLRAILHWAFGLRIGLINPFMLRACKVVYTNKDMVLEVRTVRLVLSIFAKKRINLLFDGVEVHLLGDHHDISKRNLDGEGTADRVRPGNTAQKPTARESMNIYSCKPFLRKFIKFYVLYLRFVNLRAFDLKITHDPTGSALTTSVLSFELGIQKKRTKDDLGVSAIFRFVRQGFNDIQILDLFILDVSTKLNFKTGDISKLHVNVSFRDITLPIFSLVRSIDRLQKSCTLSSKSNPKRIKSQEYYVQLLLATGRAYSNFVNSVEKLDFSLQAVHINEIPLCDKQRIICGMYEPKVYLDIQLSSFVLSIKRMYFDSPGFSLSFNYADKPIHAILNFTSISISIYNAIDKTLKNVMEIPVMNTTGNFAFQYIEDLCNIDQWRSRSMLSCHLSEPIIDLSTSDIATIALSTVDFMSFRDLNTQNPTKTAENTSSYSFSSFMKDFPKLWPKFRLELSVENPLFSLKSSTEEQFHRILVLKMSSFFSEISTAREALNDADSYILEKKIEFKGSRATYHDTSMGLKEHLFVSDTLTWRQRLQIIPDFDLTTFISSHSSRLDLSNIFVLNGVNSITNEMIGKVKPRLIEYREELKKCSQGRAIIHPESAPATERNWEEIIADIVPQWLTKASFTCFDTFLRIGSRSMLLPKEVLKSLSPQSRKDFVRGELRKVVFTMEKLTVDLVNAPKVNLSSESSASSLEDDDKGLSDSTSTLPTKGESWNIKADFHNILGQVESERSSKPDVLRPKVVYKCLKSTMDIYTMYTKSGNKLVIEWNTKKIELFYSIITHFMVLSAFYLLRNTLFEFTLKKKQKEASLSKKNSFENTKKLLSVLDIRISFGAIDWILALPDKFRVRVEIIDGNIISKYEEPTNFQSHYLRLCAESPSVPGYWVRILTVVNGSICANVKNILDKNEDVDWLDMNSTTCRIMIPHQFIIYKVFENISVMYKTLKQLHHSFKYNTNEIYINPRVKKPNKVPNMRLKTGNLFFSMEDDPFESELNMIFQIGLLEQRMRYEKTRLLDRRIAEQLETSKRRTNKASTFAGEQKVRIHSETDKISPAYKNLNNHKTPLAFANEIDNFIHHHAPNISKILNTEHSSDEISHDRETKDGISFSEFSNIRVDALKKVQTMREGFSKSWISRVKNYRQNADNEFTKNFNYLWGMVNSSLFPEKFNSRVLDFAANPLLFNMILEDVDLYLSKPDFGFEGIPDFLYDVGKGQPKTTQYSTLIPVFLDLRLSEFRTHLRDYPLPLIHMPRISKHQSKEVPAVHIHGDIVIGEEMIKSQKEVREVYIPLVPSCVEIDHDNCYSLEVPKTITAIKFFTKLEWDVNSALNTKLTWSSSYQPCIQQIMLNLDDFTKPPIDPSEKVGFWDKIRANFHARINFNWKHNGELHVLFKGSKIPYDICGKAAGFVLGFKENVTWSINQKDDPSEFMLIKSQEIIFAVPNHLAEPLLVWSRPSVNAVFLSSYSANFETSCFGYYFNEYEKPDPVLVKIMTKNYIEKTVIRLAGSVEFKIEMGFERKTDDGDRTPISKPHYEVTLCNPKFVSNKENYDAYAGFRSQYIHLGFCITSISSEAYNTIQLSPSGFEHFFNWWHNFSDTLPIRHGRAFGPNKPSKKFGRHLYTIKYRADVQPLYISHVFRDHEVNAVDKNKCAAYGLKCRTEKFAMDLHQRKELTYEHNHLLNVTKKDMKMKFHIGRVDVTDLDMRTLIGNFEIDTDLERLKQREKGRNKANHTFESFDDDKVWFDINDFTEIGTTPLDDYRGSVQVYALTYTPRFIYFKKNDLNDIHQVDIDTGKKVRPFGFECFHNCDVLELNSMNTQIKCFDDRINDIGEKMRSNEKKISELTSNGLSGLTPADKLRVTQLKIDTQKLLKGLKSATNLRMEYEKAYENSQATGENDDLNLKLTQSNTNEVLIDNNFETSSFTNRFVIHNSMLKWNNKNRDIIYRYIYLFESRRDYFSAMKHKSTAHLDGIIDAERRKNYDLNNDVKRRSTLKTTESECLPGIDTSISSRASEKLKNFEDELRNFTLDISTKIQEDYFVKFISPQIQLQTDNDKQSCVIVVAPKIEMKVIGFDTNNDGERDVNSVIEKRIGAFMTNASMFVFYKDEIEKSGELFYNSSSYGSNTTWPPWLGVELCYDGSSLTDHMLMAKTSLSVRHHKPDLILFPKYSDDYMKRIFCDLSSASFVCDARQYGSLYYIFLSLLMYKEPGNIAFKNKESKLLFKLDFSDLTALKNRILYLQETIRSLIRIEDNLSGRMSILDDVEKSDAESVVNYRTELINELILLIKASLLGVQKIRETDDSKEWHIKADDIRLSMLCDQRVPLVDVNLMNLLFKRTERSDRSDENLLVVQNIEVINLDKTSLFPIIFSSFKEEARKQVKNDTSDNSEGPLIQISWVMDHPVGGITIMRHFDVNILPVQINFEQETGVKIMNYIFPDASSLDDPEDEFDSSGASLKSVETSVNGSNGFTKISKSSLSQSSSISRANSQHQPRSLGLSRSSSTSKNIEKLHRKPSRLSAISTDKTAKNSNSVNSGPGSGFNSLSASVVADDEEEDEELEEMMNRAENYMSIVSMNIYPCTICITYRGTGTKRLINVSNFVLNLQKITFRNKTWRFLDITLHLKKTIIRALLSHAGSLIGNKLMPHSRRPEESSTVSAYATARINTFRNSISQERE